MNIYVHKDGENYGPYTVSQLREFLKTRNLEGNDLACYDGANWVKLSEVPHIYENSEPVLEQTNQNAQTSKPSPTAKINTGDDLHEVKPTHQSKKKIFILSGAALSSICMKTFYCRQKTGRTMTWWVFQLWVFRKSSPASRWRE